MEARGLAAFDASLATSLLGRPDGATEAELARHPLSQARPHLRGRAKQTARVGHIEEGLVQAETLDHGGETLEDLVQALAVRVVEVEARRQYDQIRAEAARLRHWHRRPDAKCPGLVTGRGNHASWAAPAHHYR